jgi:pilus assembly protein CpaE
MTMIPNASEQPGSAPGEQSLVAMVPHINIRAFCDNPQTADTVQRAAADRRMQRAHTMVQLGGVMGAIQAFQAQATPNLLIVEARGPRDTILAELASLAEVCQPDTKVIVIGQVNDVLLYRELLRRGVSEYLVAPFQQVQLIEAVAGLYQSAKGAPLGRVLAFVGAKGGTGSSTIAQHIAWLIARKHGTETVIADLDLAFGTAGLNFNQDLPPGLADILGQPDRMDVLLIERMLTKIGDKLSLLAGPGGVEKDFQIEPPAIESVLANLRTSVPSIVLDLPALWAPWMRFTLLHADDIIITATPDLASLRNTRSMVEFLKASRPNDPPPKLILNQAGTPKRPEVKAADFSKAVAIPVTATIPYDAQSFGMSQSNGQMIFEVAAKSKTAVVLSALAQQLWRPEKPAATGASAVSSLFSRIAKLRKK